MMTDAMKPLAISVLSNVTNFLKNGSNSTSSDHSIILDIGGRAFADITGALILKPSRILLLKVFKGMDELMASALSEVIKREEFRRLSLPLQLTRGGGADCTEHGRTYRCDTMATHHASPSLYSPTKCFLHPWRLSRV